MQRPSATSYLVLPDAQHPRVSIIIVAWRSAPMLPSCLTALAGNLTGTVPCEVIVVLNEADAKVTEFVREKVRGVHVVRSDVNLGFGGACNRAAEWARGEFLVLLNDDAQVESGWLRSLIQTADENPDAGAVGSRLLFPDGTLQEAGAVIWGDGSTAPIGRGLPAGSQRFLSGREVDYCSGASLLVRRSTWDAVGGLDPRFFPAYYEDVDLCMAIRALGQRVLYEPKSVVSHEESSSTNEEFKEFLFERNHIKFQEKWKASLTGHVPAGPDSPGALSAAAWRASGFPRRILVVDDRFPAPGMSAGFGRMFDIVAQLTTTRRSAITFAATDAGAPQDRTALGSIGVEIVEGDLGTHLKQPDTMYDVIIVSRPYNFERYEPEIRRHQPWATLIYDAEALFHRRLRLQAQQAQIAENNARAEELAEAADNMELIELGIAARADRVVCISEDEARIMSSPPGHAPIDVVQPVLRLPALSRAGFDDRRNVVFVSGWLAGPESPNVDGFRWFVTQVLPIVRESMPWIQVKVTGPEPPADLVAMASENITFVGHVEDLALLYATARVAIVPLRFGAGVKIKAVEAIQYGVPVVATTVGAEGIDQGTTQAIRVADDPKGFAANLTELMTDPHAWREVRNGIEELATSWRAEPAGAWATIISRSLRARPLAPA